VRVSTWFSAPLSERIEEEFVRFKNPYVLDSSDFTNLSGASLRFLKLLENHPPVLSVDGITGRSFTKKLALYDHANPQNPWLIIDEGVNKQDYSWMFTGPFKPAGSTHFIAVDLEKLAAVRELDPVN